MKKYITVVATLLCFIAQSYAAVTYKENKTICENSTFPTFQATNTAADDYFWYEIINGVEDEIEDARGNSSFTPDHAGEYKCKAVVSGSSFDTGNLITEGTFDKGCSNYPDHQAIANSLGHNIEYQLMNKTCSNYPMSNFTTIAKDANDVKEPYFKHITSVSGNNSNILVCDGAQSNGVKVWYARDLQLQPGVTYRFSCYVANIDSAYLDHGPNSLSNLEFRIEYNGNWGNGEQLAQFKAPTIAHKDDLAKWEFHSTNFTVPSTLTGTVYAHIFIWNHNTQQDGNDFALDDIYFGTMLSTSGSSAEEYFKLSVDTKPTITMPTAPEPCLNDPISITPTVSNAGTNPTYAWTGDATGSELTLSTTAPATAGPTTYSLKVTNGTCSSTESISVTTLDCGTTITHTDTKCLDSEFELTATTVGDSYTWILPDNSTSTETSNTLTATIARGGDDTAVRTYTCIITNPVSSSTTTHSGTTPAPTAPTTTLGDELVVNGDFEDGTFAGGLYNGFTSDYLLFGINASLTSKSDYDPTDSNTTPSGNGYVRLSDDAMDHTTPAPNGGRYFLEIDGDFRNNENDPYLSEYETVLKEPVQTGKLYELSFIAKSTSISNLSNISMLLKQGTDTYTILDFTELIKGDWKEYKVANWQSPITGTASLIIINKTRTHSGNDYIIDNISFREVLVGSTPSHASGSGDVKEIFYITPEDCKVEDSKEVKQPADQPYEFGGMSITSSGYYEYEEVGEDGTRNIHQLYLVLQPVITDYICQNEPYDKNDFNLSSRQTATAGLLETSHTVKSKATGCEHIDSTTTLKLTVLPTYEKVINDTISKGRTYDKNGFNIKTDNKKGGIYEYTLSLTTQITSIGACACDSIVNLMLTIYEPIVPMAFFTPNEDNNNDLWLIAGFDMYPDAYVQIFDRFHRLLATFKGDEFAGWDGNYNGHQMPMDDYWYVITVPDRNQQFSGHFTLKR